MSAISRPMMTPEENALRLKSDAAWCNLVPARGAYTDLVTAPDGPDNDDTDPFPNNPFVTW